jgi:WD40 repeat protein
MVQAEPGESGPKVRLWVTDFGLAHCQNQVGLTITGDLIGTLRYMSPEQALAKRVAIDHRTDIYSLGVTLYELLTLEPIFSGRDRQELLRQIAFEEPRSPRRWNKNIPAELETIVLKAMEKNPADRYTTAQEFADDLRRFLEDRPIRAKRPTLLQITRKWVRRHRPIVTTAMLAAGAKLTVTVVFLAVHTLKIQEEQKKTAAALVAEEEQRTRAEANLTTALEALDEVFMKPLEQHPEILQKSVQLQKAERELLVRGLEFYERFAQDNTDSPFLQRQTAQAFGRVAQIYAVLSKWDKRERALGRAIPIAEKLARQYPGEPDYGRHLLSLYEAQVATLRILGHLPESEAMVRRSLAASKDFTAGYPKEPKFHGAVSASCRLSTRLLAETGRLSEANQVYREVARFQEQMANDFADLPDLQGQLGETHEDYAILLRDYGEPERACALLEKAVEHHQRALRTHPNRAINYGPWRLHQRRAYYIHAITLAGLGRHDEAARTATKIPLEAHGDEENYWSALGCLPACVLLVEQNSGLTVDQRQSAVEVYLNRTRQFVQKVSQQIGNDWQVSNALAWFLITCADARFHDAEAAVALAKRATEAAPNEINVWTTLGVAHYRAGNWQAAIDGLDHSRMLDREDKYNYSNWIFLAMAHWQAGDNDTALQWWGQVRDWLKNHRTESDDLGRFRAEAANLLGVGRVRHVFSGHSMGVSSLTLSPDGRHAVSACFDRTLRLWDLQIGQELRRFRDYPGFDPGFIFTVAYSPDGRQLVSGGDPQILRLWDVQSGRVLRRFYGHTGQIRCVAFTHDGNYLLSSGRDQSVRLWDVNSSEQLRQWEIDARHGCCLAFTPDRRRFLSGYLTKTMVLWDLDSGKELHSFEGHTGEILWAAFSPDGRRLLSASEADKTVRLWDVETGRLLRTFMDSETVNGVAISPDGRLAVWGVGAAVRVWDLEKNKEVYRYDGHGDTIWAMLFLPDNRRVLSSGTDSLLQLWELPPWQEDRANSNEKSRH